MRLWHWIGLMALGVVVGLVAFLFVWPQDQAEPLALTREADAEQGAYVMRLANCVSCHTDADNDGAMLAGGPALPTDFGTFHAPNITPHSTAGIGGWTLTQFADAMRRGNSPSGHLYPIFPYEHYTLMGDQEIADLFAALQAIPASDNIASAHELGFPFNLRPTLAVWKTLFFQPARHMPVEGRSDAWNRGNYLVYGPGHCVACHTPRNLLGGLEQGRELTGNPAGGPGGRAPAITAAALLDKNYDRAGLIDTLTSGFTPGFDVLGGPMGEVIHDSTSHWTEEDLQAIAAYLLDED